MSKDDVAVFLPLWEKEHEGRKFLAGKANPDDVVRLTEIPGFFEDGMDFTLSKNRKPMSERTKGSPDYWLVCKPAWKPSRRREEDEAPPF